METRSAQLAFLIVDFKVLPALLRFGTIYTGALQVRVARAASSDDLILIKLGIDYQTRYELRNFVDAAKIFESFDAGLLSFSTSDPELGYNSATPLATVIRSFESAQSSLQLQRESAAYA